MSERDLFSALADKRESSMLLVKRSLADFTGGILLTVCVLLTALFPLVALRLVNPFSPEFFVNTAYTCCSSYLSYLLFFPEGKRAEAARNRLFIEGEERLILLSSPIKASFLSASFAKGKALKSLPNGKSIFFLRAATKKKKRRAGKRKEKGGAAFFGAPPVFLFARSSPR